MNPIKDIKNDSVDFVVSFQVIEHIKDDQYFISEIHRVLKPGGTTRHIWDNEMPVSSPREVRRDPYYLALIQLLKYHDMENVKIKIEDNGFQGYEDGIPQYHYAFILTARKKL